MDEIARTKAVGSLRLMADSIFAHVLPSYLDDQSLAQLSATCRTLRYPTHSLLPLVIRIGLPDKLNEDGGMRDEYRLYKDFGPLPFAVKDLIVQVNDFHDQG